MSPSCQSSYAALWRRRDIIRVLTGSNLKKTFGSTGLGMVWWLLDPLLMTAVYTLLVKVIKGGKLVHEPFPVFVLCGVATWKFFAACVSGSFKSLEANSSIIKAYAFPRAVMPISATLNQVAMFLGALTLLSFGSFIFVGDFGLGQLVNMVLFLPLLLLLLSMFTMGIALAFSALGQVFSDLKKIIGHLMRFGFYGSPGLYAIGDVLNGYEGLASLGELSVKHLYLLNPMAHFIYSFRCLFYYGRQPDLWTLMVLALLAVISFVIGLALFRKIEAKLPKIL